MKCLLQNKLKMEFINKLNAMDDENNPILFIYEL